MKRRTKNISSNAISNNTCWSDAIPLDTRAQPSIMNIPREIPSISFMGHVSSSFSSSNDISAHAEHQHMLSYVSNTRCSISYKGENSSQIRQVEIWETTDHDKHLALKNMKKGNHK